MVKKPRCVFHPRVTGLGSLDGARLISSHKALDDIQKNRLFRRGDGRCLCCLCCIGLARRSLLLAGGVCAGALCCRGLRCRGCALCRRGYGLGLTRRSLLLRLGVRRRLSLGSSRGGLCCGLRLTRRPLLLRLGLRRRCALGR